MKPDQPALLRTPLWIVFTGCALLAAPPSFAQSQLAAPGQTSLRPPASASSPSRLGAPATVLGAPSAAPGPNLVGQATKSPTPGGVAEAVSARLLTKSEAASPASRLLVAKAQLMEQAKQTGGKTDTNIANLQTGDSVKLSLLTPRQAWANLVVERPDKVDFDAGTFLFDGSVSKVNAMPGNPACQFTVPSEGYYMVDVLVEPSDMQPIITWTTPHQAEDHRAQAVSHKVQAGLNHILVSLHAGKPPTYSMVHTVQVFDVGRYTFISCEITRLK